MGQSMCKITVFTPTYNRAYIINNLYNSLVAQSYRDFEWLVVDDGSTDATEELFKKWKNECRDFPIRYYKTENGGKCRAINTALKLAKGELFFTVDSDDYLTDDALQKIANWEKQLPKDECFCGVAGNLGIAKDITNNTIFENEYFDGSFFDRYGKIDGERAIVIYTDIHRKYLYPEFTNEKFMTEAVVWNRMAHDGYRMRFFNDIIWIYEYKEDGLTKAGNRLFINNPYGYGLWLKEKILFTNCTIIQLLKLYYSFTCELSPYHDYKTIATAIGTNRFMIVCMRIIYRMKNCRRFLSGE